MIAHTALPRGTSLLIIAAALVVILWGIYLAQSVVVLFLVSAFLAVIGRVPVLWMERKGIPSLVAVLLVMAAMVALVLGIGVFVGASVNNFSNALPSYQARIHHMLTGFKALLVSRGIAMTDEILFGYVNPGALMSLTAGLFAGLSSALSNMLIVLFLITFILLEISGFPAKLRLVHDSPRASVVKITSFMNDMKRYMVIKTLINLVAGVLITVLCLALGVDYAVLWGFLGFLLHFIPSIGSIVAAVPAVLLALIQLGPGPAAFTAAGYLAIGMIIGNVIEPKIMGRRFGMSPLVVFVSLILWGNLLGIVGALLCVPLTMSLKLACEANEGTRWIAVLLGPETASDIPPAGSKNG
jgi:predicted PurR-regulated permease PerM